MSERLPDTGVRRRALTEQIQAALPVLEALRKFPIWVSPKYRAAALTEAMGWDNPEYTAGKWAVRFTLGGSLPLTHMDPETTAAYCEMAMDWHANSTSWEAEHCTEE